MDDGVSRSGWAVTVLLLAVALASACGGGGEPASARPARLEAAAPASPLDVDMLLDWAEATYPALFPRSETGFTRASPGYDYFYREYAATGNALAVARQNVYVQGPAAGNTLRQVGTIADYECDALPEACWPGATIEIARRLDGSWASSGMALPSRASVIRNAQDWTALWQQLNGPTSAPPAVDFSAEVVVGGTNGWGGSCGGFGALRVLRQGGDLRLLWGKSWNPPMIACTAIVVPQVAFVAVAQPVDSVQFVQVNGCWRPLPVAGAVDPQLLPDAPAYVMGYQPGVEGVAETGRLQARYGFAATAVSATGFAADLPAPVLAQLRCERSLRFITHNRHQAGSARTRSGGGTA